MENNCGEVQVQTKVIAPTRCGNLELRWGERTYVMGIVNVNPDSFSGDWLGGDVDATMAIGIAHGADIVRVHDVKEMMRVCRMSDAIVRRR